MKSRVVNAAYTTNYLGPVLLGLFCLAIFNGCVNPPFRQLLDRNEEINDTERFVTNAKQWTENYEEALQMAQQSNRLILADFTGTDWCTWCKRLDREVFQQPEFQSWADQHMVLLKVDFPRNTRQAPEIAAQNEQLKQKYEAYIQGYPTVLFLTKHGEVVGRLGYVKGGPKAFVEAAEVQMSGRFSR